MDALAALVPAEVLVLHAFMVEATTETKKVAGKAVTTIKDAGALEATFWVCIGLAAFLFLVGRIASKKGPLEKSDALRALIPAAAFVGWVIIQKSTAWDAVSPDSLSEGARALIGAAGAIVLGVFAAALGVKLDKQDPSG
ncbi:MAG: hypothetical protein H0T69_17585 [Thermoleophilaceae bacterium]|nr:hypothetical protein [Thermoleophilaceae bacterium]